MLPVWWRQGVRSEAEVAREREAARGAAAAEARVVRLLELLGPVLEDTKTNIEKKQARTYEEMQAELNEADQVRSPPLPHAPPSICLMCPHVPSRLCCRAAASHAGMWLHVHAGVRPLTGGVASRCKRRWTVTRTTTCTTR